MKRQLVQYISGFILSLIITLIAYGLVVGDMMQGGWLLIVLGVLALIQMIVQLLYFLHLGEETKPRLKLLAFSFMLLVLLIVVAGTLWIMNHLNYRMINFMPHEKDDYMTIQKDKGF